MKTEVLQDPNDRVIERFTKLIMENPVLPIRITTVVSFTLKDTSIITQS